MKEPPPLCEVSWKNANLYLEVEGGLFDLGLLIEKQTRVPTEFSMMIGRSKRISNQIQGVSKGGGGKRLDISVYCIQLE